MTYAGAIQFLYGLQLFGANFGLENTRRLAALAGNPQDKLRFIHVAGTNGKGSTCAMLESIYRAAGLRVGLFTSPHLVSFRERIQVNRRLISEPQLVRLIEKLRPLLGRFPPDNHLTLFEVVTVMALKFFADQKCDLVIWETGLGGRLDATNIVTPLASVITNIGLDHQQWLGDTPAKIAAEKAGIIKPGVPVVTATVAPEARSVIKKTARAKNAPLQIVTAWTSRPGRSQLPAPPWLGDHQKTNAAVALATVAVLQRIIPVTEKQIRAGLALAKWPGRLQLIPKKSGGKILLDGAHNPDGADALARTLRKSFKFRRTLILGVLEDKNWRQICRTLAPLAVRILTVPVASERTASAAALAAACRPANARAEIIACSSLTEALEKSRADVFVIVTGSLYLVGEALERLGRLRAGDGERQLNRWTGQNR